MDGFEGTFVVVTVVESSLVQWDCEACHHVIYNELYCCLPQKSRVNSSPWLIKIIKKIAWIMD